MQGRATDLLLSPETFFRDLFGEKVSFRVPLIIVLTGAVIAAVNAYMIGNVTGALMAQAVPGYGSVMGLISVAAAFITTFLAWVILSGLFHVISMAFKGSGEFRKTLAAVGWGYFPMVISSAISLLISLLYIPHIRVPSLRSAQDPSAIVAAMQQMMNQPAMREMMMMTAAVGIIFMIWAAMLWVAGIRHARALSGRNAAITVLVPILLYVAYSLVTAFSFISLPGGA